MASHHLAVDLTRQALEFIVGIWLGGVEIATVGARDLSEGRYPETSHHEPEGTLARRIFRRLDGTRVTAR